MDARSTSGLSHNKKIVLLRFHVGASRPGVRNRVARNLTSFSDHLGNNTGHIIGNTWVFRNWSKNCKCHRSKWTRNFWVKLLNSFFWGILVFNEFEPIWYFKLLSKTFVLSLKKMMMQLLPLEKKIRSLPFFFTKKKNLLDRTERGDSTKIFDGLWLTGCFKRRINY